LVPQSGIAGLNAGSWDQLALRAQIGLDRIADQYNLEWAPTAQKKSCPGHNPLKVSDSNSQQKPKRTWWNTKSCFSNSESVTEGDQGSIFLPKVRLLDSSWQSSERSNSLWALIDDHSKICQPKFI
jgi:hypothetical protein